jgi:eukaryotic-like serine/threonine-protein kinase
MPILTASERVGSVLDGKYELYRIVARGGMGVLFEARHCLTRRKVAVKLLKAEEDPEGTRAERFLREARAAASIRDAHVVDVLDMGDDAGAPYVVMEFLEGRSLEELLGERARLSPEQTLDLLMPIFGALARAHDLGIVHRDLKPANIFLSRDPCGRCVPKLLDFGVAKVWPDVGLTDAGTVVGTPQYMSPEQTSGAKVGPATDVWAAGVVLYRCLSGVLPFPGTNAASVLAAIERSAVKPLVELDPALPPRFCAAIERALSKNLAWRYADMRALTQALLVTVRADSTAVPRAADRIGLAQWPEWVDVCRHGSKSNPASTSPALLEMSSGTSSVDGAANVPVAVHSSDSRKLSRAARAAVIVALVGGVAATALFAQRWFASGASVPAGARGLSASGR